MAEALYQPLNESYMDMVDVMHKAFFDVPGLQVEFDVVTAIVKKFGWDSDKVFNHIQENISEVVTGIHAKNERIMVRENNKGRVALFECLHLYTIFPRMQPSEKAGLWTGLGKLVQHLCLLAGIGKNLPDFYGIATDFMTSNPNVSANNVQAKVYSQMFTNPAIAGKIRGILLNGDIGAMQAGIGQVLKGFNMTGEGSPEGPSSATVSEDVESDDDAEDDAKQNIETKTEILGDVPVSTTTSSLHNSSVHITDVDDDAELAALFQNMVRKDEKISKKNRKKKGKNVLGHMISEMESGTYPKEDLEKMKALASASLGGSEETEQSRQLKSMFELMGQGMTPSQMKTQLKEKFGAESSQIDAITSTFDQLRTEFTFPTAAQFE